jgi:hypothetical protein
MTLDAMHGTSLTSPPTGGRPELGQDASPQNASAPDIRLTPSELPHASAKGLVHSNSHVGAEAEIERLQAALAAAQEQLAAAQSEMEELRRSGLILEDLQTFLPIAIEAFGTRRLLALLARKVDLPIDVVRAYFKIKKVPTTWREILSTVTNKDKSPGSGQVWTDEEISDLRMFAADGKSDFEAARLIAERSGNERTESDVQKTRKSLKIMRSRGSAPWSDEEKARLQELFPDATDDGIAVEVSKVSGHPRTVAEVRKQRKLLGLMRRRQSRTK